MAFLAEDEELEGIKLRRLREMLRGRGAAGKPGSTGEHGDTPSSNPVDLTDGTFGDFVQGNPFVVVDCWAPWCGPCRMVSPVVEELARDYAGRIIFGKLNVDENRGVAGRFGVMSIPTLLVFKGGRLVDRIVGAMPRRALEPKITRHL
ncbi:MAG: thioredoxin [Candidatus Bathyarchaeota archaeon]|nr:thioredoxin [Candidatus Bathyarchaeota archaeon]